MKKKYLKVGREGQQLSPVNENQNIIMNGSAQTFIVIDTTNLSLWWMIWCKESHLKGER